MVRRFLSAALFASAFVWVAVRFFDVETEIVWVLFIYSIGFVILMIFIGFLFVPFISLFRKKRSSLLEGTSPQDSNAKQDEEREVHLEAMITVPIEPEEGVAYPIVEGERQAAETGHHQERQMLTRQLLTKRQKGDDSH